MIKNIILIIAIVLNLNAVETDDLYLTFTDKTNIVVDIVKSKILTAEEKNNQIIETISPMFDFELMAKLSLGKRAWNEMDVDKRDEFTKLYVKRMKKSYSAKVDKYTDEKIVINSVNQTKKTRIVLQSSLISQDDDLKVVYKFYKPKEQNIDKYKWLVYDVIIAGVSIIKTDKAQFKAVLQNSSIDALMDKLK